MRMTFEQRHYQALILSRKAVHQSAARALSRNPSPKAYQTFEITKDSLIRAVQGGAQCGLRNIKALLRD